MKTHTLKKLLIVFMCLAVFITTFSGCTKMTEDEYYWASRWEEEQVWVEYDNSDIADSNEGNMSVENDGFDTPDLEDENLSVENDVSDSEENNSSSGNNIQNSSINNTSDSSEENNSSDEETSSDSQKQPGINKNAKVDPDDKPTVKNTANLMKPFNVKSDSQANTLRNRVIESKSKSVNVTGKTYYISYKGNDNNDGLSPETPWLTLTKLSYAMQITSGDAVLFERGGVYRGGIKCVSGVYYGAYGKGDKPAIYRSAENYAKTDWIKNGSNIWVSPAYVKDAGIIVFDHGKFAGDRKTAKSQLTENGDYFCDDTGKIYLYMNKQPADKYKSIEIGPDSHIFTIPRDGHDIIIDNITMKYGGAMGVQGSTGSKNITITNCEIGWIGGSYLREEDHARYGNGIEFWEACENIYVENNWIYQIYDSGFTHQGNNKEVGFVAKDILFTKNLVEYCNFGSIEYWAPGETKHRMENVEYSSNILRFAGYGWGYYGQPATHIYSTDNFNRATNFVIKDNVLDTALSKQVRCVHHGGTLPKMSGNTFIGKVGERLGSIGISASSTLYMFDENTQAAIRADWGDATAEIIFND